MEKSRQWAIRCIHEAQMNEANSFITLTYSDEHLPKNESLNVEHWQKFVRSLRKKAGKFRYFHCGEYGDENMRPHYHACMFGIDFFGDRSLWKNNNGMKLYRSELLEETWGKGFCSIGELTYESAAYVSRYVMKKITGDQAEYAYRGVDPETLKEFDVKPEYATMSRKPGIGAGWLEKFKSDVYPFDEVVLEGRRFRPPRFYDERLPVAELDELRKKRFRKAQEHKGDLTPERLLVREQVALRKGRELKRVL